MSSENETNLSRPLAPEDIQRTMYVTPTHVVEEHYPFSCDDEPWKPASPRQMVWLPEHSGRPLKVVEVCLPFVLVEKVNGKHSTLDVRRHRLALLTQRYGDAVFVHAKAERKAKQCGRRRRTKRCSDD